MGAWDVFRHRDENTATSTNEAIMMAMSRGNASRQEVGGGRLDGGQVAARQRRAMPAAAATALEMGLLMYSGTRALPYGVRACVPLR